MMILGRLREFREKAALSQGDLAERAELTRVTVTRIEGGHPARPSTIRKLARVLRCRPAQLMSSEENG
jgi:transcriptional regulator with XRE-family HTH domain